MQGPSAWQPWGGNETVTFRHPSVVERIEGTSERVLIEVARCDGRRDQSVGRRVPKNMWDEGELWVDKAQAVEHHCLHRLAGGHQTPFWVLLGGLINALSDAEFCKHARDQAQRISDVTVVGLWHEISSFEEILLLPQNYSNFSGCTRPAPARHRKSALRPVGPGASHQPAPPTEWITIPVPAIVSQERFDAAQARLDQNTQMALINNTSYTYLLWSVVEP